MIFPPSFALSSSYLQPHLTSPLPFLNLASILTLLSPHIHPSYPCLQITPVLNSLLLSITFISAPLPLSPRLSSPSHSPSLLPPPPTTTTQVTPTAPRTCVTCHTDHLPRLGCRGSLALSESSSRRERPPRDTKVVRRAILPRLKMKGLCLPARNLTPSHDASGETKT